MTDTTTFPNPVYKDTVLEPLFEGAKAHFTKAVNAINQAHLVMLSETGILPDDISTAIAGALKDIDTTLDINALKYTGEHEDYFFQIEAELVNRLGADIAGKLHTARSRNDMDHTVFKMALKTRLDLLLSQTVALTDALIVKAMQERETYIVAYTHGQPAQPTSFGHYLNAAVEILLRDITRLLEARAQLDFCPMGAAAITTTGFPIDRHRVSDLLGFSEPLRNSYSCIAGVDYITGLYSAIKLTFLHLGRVIQDLQFWSSFEVGQLYVPNSFAQVSSIMPQKRNPVPIEHLRLLSSLTIGRCDTMVNTMHNTPFTDMNDSEGEVQQAGYAAFESGGRVLKLLTAFIPALSINQDRVRKNADAACITVTELADRLVRDEGLSFRQAHKVGSVVSKTVLGQEMALCEGFIAFTMAFENETGRMPEMNETIFREAVSIENFVAVRTCFGGPGAAPMGEAFETYLDTLEGMRMALDENSNRKAKSVQALAAAFAGLV